MDLFSTMSSQLPTLTTSILVLWQHKTLKYVYRATVAHPQHKSNFSIDKAITKSLGYHASISSQCFTQLCAINYYKATPSTVFFLLYNNQLQYRKKFPYIIATTF